MPLLLLRGAGARAHGGRLPARGAALRRAARLGRAAAAAGHEGGASASRLPPPPPASASRLRLQPPASRLQPPPPPPPPPPQEAASQTRLSRPRPRRSPPPPASARSGFRRWFPPPTTTLTPRPSVSSQVHNVEWVADGAAQFIQKHGGADAPPFFLYVGWTLPHGPAGWSKRPSWRGHSWPPRAHQTASEGLGLPSALVRRGPASQAPPRGRGLPARGHQS